MAYYINDKGIVIEALQYDESEENKKEIERKFGVELDHPMLGVHSNLFFNTIFVGKLYKYYYVYQETTQPRVLDADYFEKHFKPITDSRVFLVEQAKSVMLSKLYKRQYKGDWENKSFSTLFAALMEETEELKEELRKIDGKTPDADLQKVIYEAADVMNYAAMIIDKAANIKVKESLQDGEI